MLRAFAVLIVSLTGCLLVAGVGIEDTYAPEGLDPIEVLEPPKKLEYKEMKGSGYEVEREYSIDQIDEEEDKRKHSQWISTYLQYLMMVRGRIPEEPVGNALDVMSLLTAYSWLCSFNPEKTWLIGTTPLSIDESDPLAKIKFDIVKELKNRNAITPVSDVILFYTDGVSQSIKDDLLTDVDAYRKMVFDKSLLTLMFNFNIKESIVNDNDRYIVMIGKNKLLLDFHPVALKMALQSYLKLFDPGLVSSEETFSLHSSDGQKRKPFTMPLMAPDKFEQMVFDAELEDHDITPEQTKEHYRRQQNSIISYYLKELEYLRQTTMSNFQDSNTLNIVKLLILQSWIYMLHPELKHVALVYPVEDYMTPEGIHKAVVLDLKKTIIYTEIVDAIIRYNNVLHMSVGHHLMMQAREMCPIIEKSIEETSTCSYGPDRDTLVQAKKENVLKLADLKLMAQFHLVTVKMCLQSYVLDFLKEPYPTNVVLSSTTGVKLVMDLPPLGIDSYESLAD